MGLGIAHAVEVNFRGPGMKPVPQMCPNLVFKESITVLW